jgi:hypothetical protein
LNSLICVTCGSAPRLRPDYESPRWNFQASSFCVSEELNIAPRQ